MNGPASREDLGREETIFNAAVQLRDPTKRAVYLGLACDGEPELRARMEKLLASDAEDAFFARPLAQPAILSSAVPAAASSESSANVSLPEGERIGRYRLIQKVGEGGCGVVYMAEQEEPIRRRVALKIIKLGMDTKSVIARFDAERQALALMDHPNIAKVHDAGATSTGRPYFVMELVRGVKITDYCDGKKLSTHQRLELFIQVCQAVQHAHQKGIIHRDLKPSNILVTVNDGIAVPKVIDFGISKATTGERLTDKTIFTAFEQFLGTPAYMSPEQAEITSVDTDTRSDIYSLGVLLYELLTGQTPFDGRELLTAGLEEMRRTLREKEPARPSARLSTLGAEELTTAARRRGLDGPKLVSVLRGDLDWIVMKCLEKDRARRYETANGLAQDIQRHLSNEVVVARPPSRFYEFQKTVRRHKVGFAAAGAVIGALLTGLAASMWMFFQEREAKEDQARLRLVAQAKEQKAQTEADKSRQVAQFLEDMLQGVGPSVALGRDTTILREILDKTAQRLDRDLGGNPDVEADLRATLGGIYNELGDPTNAAAMHRKALDIRRKLYGTEHLTIANSLEDLAKALQRQCRVYEAEAAGREALAIKCKLLRPGDPGIAACQDTLAMPLYFQHKDHEAEKLQLEALATQRLSLGRTNLAVAESLLGLALTLDNMGRPLEAEGLAHEGLAIHRAIHGEDHPSVATLFDALGRALELQGEYSEAESAFRNGLRVRQKLLGDAHCQLAWSFYHVGRTLLYQGKTDGAEGALREAVALTIRHKGPLSTLKVRSWLALLLEVEGRQEEADKVRLESLVEARESGDRCGSADILNDLGWQLATATDPGFSDATTAVRFARKAVAATSRTNASYLGTLAAAYARAAKFQEAVSVQKEAIWLLHTDEQKQDYASRLRIYEAGTAYRDDDGDDDMLAIRASRLLTVRRFVEAEPVARECLAICERHIPDDWLTCSARSILGGSLLGQGKYAEAEPLLLSAYDGMKRRENKIPPTGRPRLKETVGWLVQLYGETQEPGKAADWNEKLAMTESEK